MKARLRRTLAFVIVAVLLLTSLPKMGLPARAESSCGDWHITRPKEDQRLTATRLSSTTDTTCQGSYQLENKTQVTIHVGQIPIFGVSIGLGVPIDLGIGGYTLAVTTHNRRNYDIDFALPFADRVFPDGRIANRYFGGDHTMVLLAYSPELRTQVRDLASDANVDLDANITLDSLTADVLLFIITAILDYTLGTVSTCLIDPVAVFFASLGLADNLTKAVELAAAGKFSAADEFNRALPAVITGILQHIGEAISGCAQEIGVAIVAELVKKLTGVGASVTTTKLSLQLVAYIAVAAKDKVAHQSRPLTISLGTEPLRVTANSPSPVTVLPRPTTTSAIVPPPATATASSAPRLITPTLAPVPSANEIAYVSAQEDLWVANIDGTNARKLIAGPVAAPKWSRDGKRIAYFRIDRNPGTNAIVSLWIANADGSNPLRVDQEIVGHTNVQWGPGDSALYYVSGHQGSPETIVRFDLTTNRGEQIGLNGWVFDVASDGTIAFHECDSSGRCSLSAIGASGQRTVLLPGGNSSVCCPAWSPDGKRIAMTRGSAILVANRDGSGQTQIATASPALGGLSWSPDGTTLVFGTAPGVGPQSSSTDIWTVPATGGNPVKRFAGTAPSWRPSGVSSGGQLAPTAAVVAPTASSSQLDQGALERRLAQFLTVKSVRAAYLPDGADNQPRVVALVGGRGEDFSGEAAACAKYGGANLTNPKDTTPCLLVIKLGQTTDTVLSVIDTTFYHPAVVNFCVGGSPNPRVVIHLYTASSRTPVPYRQEYRYANDRLSVGTTAVLELGGKLPTELPCSEVLR